MAKEIDRIKVREVVLFAENDKRCYDALMINYLPNLQKKLLKGTYDKKLAVKLLVYYYTNYVRPEAIKRTGMGYDPKLNPAEREVFAQSFVDYLWDEYLSQTQKDNPKKK
jgi:hypothetical protein